MQKSLDSPPKFQRGYSLDQSILQRPPSGETVRSLVRSQSLQQSIDVPPKVQEDNPDNRTDATDAVEIRGEENTVLENASIVHGVHFTASCIECVKPYPVLGRSDISPGDHIIYSGAIYDHHAIVETVDPTENGSDSEVRVSLIHASNTTLGASSGFLFGGKAKIEKTCQVLDYKTTKIVIVKYSYMPYTPNEIIERARAAVEENSFKYHLFQNNCEHFATWCVTSKRLSVQVGKFRLTMKMFLSRGFTGLSDERQRNDEAYKQGMLCNTCYEINNRLFSATRKPVLHEDDIKVGDIITYTYYNLYHDAVVLEKKDQTYGNKIQVTLAHYAFCGPLSHRTIIEEQINIQPDGSVTVIQYEPASFDTYSPEETVCRARKRIGEQLFSFFVNDSSHFARWCKLKLTRKVIESCV